MNRRALDKYMYDLALKKGLIQKGETSRKKVLGIYDSKLELAYSQHLGLLTEARQVMGWVYHGWRFDLTDGVMYAANTRRPGSHVIYTPDFLVILPGGAWEFHEVKGHWRQHDRMAWRLAAGQHSNYGWVAAQRKGRAWTYERFKKEVA